MLSFRVELQVFFLQWICSGKKTPNFHLITWIGVEHHFHAGVKDMLDPQRISDIFLFDTEEEVKLFHSVDLATNQAHS